MPSFSVFNPHQLHILFPLFQLRVPLFHHAEGVVGDVHRQGDVLVGEGGVDEVVVVAGEEQSRKLLIRLAIQRNGNRIFR